MTREEVINRLQLVFDQIFIEPPKLNPALSAQDVEEWDSLLQISIVVQVEVEFKIRFRVGEVETTHNIGEFADLIAKRSTEKGLT